MIQKALEVKDKQHKQKMEERMVQQRKVMEERLAQQRVEHKQEMDAMSALIIEWFAP